MLPSGTELEQSLAAFNLHPMPLLNFKKLLFSLFFLSVPFNPSEAKGSILTCCVTQGATLNHWSSICLEQPGLSPACIYLAFWWVTMKSSAAGCIVGTSLQCWCHFAAWAACLLGPGQKVNKQAATVFCAIFLTLIGGNVLTQNPPK